MDTFVLVCLVVAFLFTCASIYYSVKTIRILREMERRRNRD